MCWEMKLMVYEREERTFYGADDLGKKGMELKGM